MIPDFSLPSNPAHKITDMKTATVADMLDFSEVDFELDEVLLSKFLNRVQKTSDARTWTAEDRVFALFWYYINTETNTQTTISYSGCNECGGSHSEPFDYKTLGLNYAQLPSNRIPETFSHGAETVTVEPLTGIQAERLESFSIVMDGAKRDFGENSGEYRRRKAELDLLKLVMHVRFGDEGKDYEEVSEAKIKAMTSIELKEFGEKVRSALLNLTHGLESTYSKGKLYLLSPVFSCPDKRRGEIQIRLPFRYRNYIPAL